MSLRLRLLAAIALMLAVALCVGAGLVLWRADHSVQVEMRAAQGSAEDVAHQEMDRAAGASPRALTATLINSFNGSRHVQAEVYDAGGLKLGRSRLAVSREPPPAWFDAMIDVGRQSEWLAVSAGGAPQPLRLRLTTDPTNEIAEVWGQAIDAFAIMLVFCGGIFVAVGVIVGRSLRSFQVLDAALREMADGQYAAALPERGSPEFVALARGFNHMAERVRDFDLRNRRLREQLLTLQAEERAEVARDLHDEVGPYLFAINVDAEDIPRLVRRGAIGEIPARAAAIREAAGHIQAHVKAIVRRLRPAEALEFGLKPAIDALAAFWVRRSPGLAFEIEVETGDAILDRRIEDAAYRVVQESVSNAVRHGRPGLIHIGARADGGGLRVRIADDGAGLDPGVHTTGVGLAGMAERAEALGGGLDVGGNPEGRGACVEAWFPLTPPVVRPEAAA